MNKRFAISMTTLSLISTSLLAAPAMAETKLKKKAGYYEQCTFDGRCETIYMRPKGGAKFMRVKAKDSKLKKKSGYWVECQYSGLGEVCSYVYARPKPGAKFRRIKADAGQ